jgi:hypothetical protein
MLVFFFCSHRVTWFAYINLVLVDKLAFDQDHDNGIWYLTPILVPDCLISAQLLQMRVIAV